MGEKVKSIRYNVLNGKEEDNLVPTSEDILQTTSIVIYRSRKHIFAAHVVQATQKQTNAVDRNPSS